MVQPLDSLLAIHKVGGPTAEKKRRQARRWGEGLLDQLDRLRLALVDGVIPRHELERIAELVERKPVQVDNPLMTVVLDEIALRARVEIAKFGRGA